MHQSRIKINLKHFSMPYGYVTSVSQSHPERSTAAPTPIDRDTVVGCLLVLGVVQIGVASVSSVGPAMAGPR
jgi:hypothetical protein